MKFLDQTNFNNASPQRTVDISFELMRPGSRQGKQSNDQRPTNQVTTYNLQTVSWTDLVVDIFQIGNQRVDAYKDVRCAIHKLEEATINNLA